MFPNRFRMAATQVICAIFGLACFVHANPWPATDGLGRKLPEHTEVGAPRKDRFVAVFYFLWLYQHSKTGPHDITKILEEHPEAVKDGGHPAWGPMKHFHHFAEPLFGYYRSTDEWVYRKHAEMLADAQVDVVIFDCSNNFTYKESYMALCRAFDQARKDGVNVPKIAFLGRIANKSRNKVVNEVYENLYKPGLYKDLWFQWEGKPLIMAYPEAYSNEIQKFFTFRPPKGSYHEPATRKDQWAWLEASPLRTYGGTPQQPEQMAVGVAVNARGNNQYTALSDPLAMSRSYHQGKHDKRPDAYKYGLHFQEQWDAALEKDPKLIFVTGWNEWVAMRFEQFHRYKAPVVFVDLYDVEGSRDIEPMKGGYGDAYYYQLIANVRRHKGTPELPKAGPPASIVIDGKFDDWEQVGPTFDDHRGDIMHRDHPGWGEELHYRNQLGRNDIIACKVARDDTSLSFMVETAKPLTRPKDYNWLRLLINVDRSTKTGWEGYDYLLSYDPKTKHMRLLQSQKGWNWQQLALLPFAINGQRMEVAIPRDKMPTGSKMNFEFKWVDHLGKENDIMDFYTCGEAAPGGRFNYLYQE